MKQAKGVSILLFLAVVIAVLILCRMAGFILSEFAPGSGVPGIPGALK
jgi:hypothetical protein